MRTIYWLRSDLRVLDNQTLAECLQKNEDPVFVLVQAKASPHRQKFINESQAILKRTLEEEGFDVLSTDSPFFDFLPTLFRSQPFEALYFTREYAWDERQEEKQVREFCLKNNVEVHSFDQGTLIREKDLPFGLVEMPFIFTDFRKKIESHLLIKDQFPAPFSIEEVQSGQGFVGGEDQARARLRHYLWDSKEIEHYKETRNGLIRFDDSSKLSPWLNTGCLSPRTVYHELKKYEKNVCENDSTYWLFFELLWRDYFKFFSLRHGHKIFQSSGVRQGSSPNKADLETFQSWCEGKTMDNFINANMNELNQTGWMSNRGRQNVASYLIHDLGLNWTWGAAYFEEKLLDYDPDLNWGNWLYLSGRGSDPRARKFNTAKQADTYDPQGTYRRLWTSDV